MHLPDYSFEDGGEMKGHIRTTDEEIIKAFKTGKFILQICHEQFVGIARVRKVLDREGLRE